MGRPKGSKNETKEKTWGDNLRLNIGCGGKKVEGAVNIDRACSDLDMDLEKADFPFPDASVEYVQADHVLEHIHNLLPLMNEIHRVMKPGAELRVRVPIFPTEQAFQDPTHCRYFTGATFRYWMTGDFLFEECGKNYGIKPFSRMIQHTEGFELVARLWK